MDVRLFFSCINVSLPLLAPKFSCVQPLAQMDWIYPTYYVGLFGLIAYIYMEVSREDSRSPDSRSSASSFCYLTDRFIKTKFVEQTQIIEELQQQLNDLSVRMRQCEQENFELRRLLQQQDISAEPPRQRRRLQ
eukprot:704702-Amphidinium_carterae.2